ncbi:MAG: cation diffusion facilitator family transporter [Alphaproteobacteria bacterium]|jgi:cation diffusion facilitator family transporter
MLSKLSIGLMTNSTAIIADAIHSLTDVANNIIAWFAVKVSQSPADSNHQYGHQKYEQVAVFVLASMLTIVAFEVITQAYSRFGQPVEQSMLGLAVLIGTMVINICLTVWQRRWAKRLHSPILHADASHTLSDALTTLVVIVGWQLAAQGYYWLDTIFAIIISCMIFFLAFKLFKSAVPILVDYSDIDSQKLNEALSKIPAVKQIVQIRVRRSSEGRVADVIARVGADLTVRESQAITNNIKALLEHQFAIKEVIVNYEPDTSLLD